MRHWTVVLWVPLNPSFSEVEASSSGVTATVLTRTAVGDQWNVRCPSGPRSPKAGANDQLRSVRVP